MANPLQEAEKEAIAKAYGKLSHFDQNIIRRDAKNLVAKIKYLSPSSQLWA